MQRHMTSFQYKFKNEAFKQALKDTCDRDRAETLANVWFNVHFLGCKYSEQMMQQVEKYTSEEFREYTQRRKL